ncbi:MAG: ammonium transporter [Desulfovibrionaceae bacterium]|nr:ammonium transporter [Desulfovibrionaceae bacterium]
MENAIFCQHSVFRYEGSGCGISKILAVSSILLSSMLLPETVWAADEALPQAYGDILWLLLGGMFVMFMQPGFALVECGLTRAKNAANIMLKNYADFTIGSLIFYFVGFGLMFGSDWNGMIGSSFFCMSGVTGNGLESQHAWAFWFFQSVFCATSATIVSGAVAERTNFKAYMLVSMLISLCIYPVSGHWAWAGLFEKGTGWLENMGFIDFAGSTVVHSVGGWIALAGAIVLGPRIGKYGKDGTARAIPGHNIPMAGLGVFVLWFAWFGFNCASTGAVDGTIGFIAANTLLSTCAGAMTAMFFMWFLFKKADPSMTFNGCLAGLVGITAGCAEVSPLGSICIGGLSGILVVASVLFIDQKLRIDDPVGAVSVHGVCGAFGTVMVGLFASPDFGSTTGLLYGGGVGSLGVQIIGVLAIGAWAFIMGLIAFKLVNCFIKLRVSPEEELKGLDTVEHGADAYSGFQIFSNE